ncbi:MAG: pyridoxamine 5'-phosphate oxidase family protein [Desulfovibrio sp.]|nr:pyridoxamine 5'-phosphate oxidase family protein [Desulfovibrio sp.]
MKAILMILAVLMLTPFMAIGSAAFAAEGKGQKKEAAMQEVHNFIKSCGYYFLATVDGDQPKVRPFGTVAIYDGRIYIQTGKKKNVSRQMARNPKIEICAYDGKGKWVRIQAVAVNDDRREVKQFMLDSYPELKRMYAADDDNTQVLYLKDVTARFHSFGGEAETVEF